MSFVYGTALMVAAIFLLGFAKYAVTRYEESSWVRRFAATEGSALIITTITAFGVAFICAGVASDESALGLVELGASLGLVGLSILGVVRIFRMSNPVGTGSAPAPAKTESRAAG